MAMKNIRLPKGVSSGRLCCPAPERGGGISAVCADSGGWCFLHAPPTTAPDQREGPFSTAKRSVLLPPSG